MKTVIGIDVGGSATKIVGFKGGVMLEPMVVKANDPLTSAYGAFGKFLAENNMGIGDIERIMTTGVGSTFLPDVIYGLPTVHLEEFDCIGRGGLYLTKLDKAIVVSMGTGTAMVKCDGTQFTYLGGTGVGGGTLTGLSKLIVGMEHTDNISELASEGELSKVDLQVGGITKKALSGLASEVTAANFGNVSDTATKADLALGTVNLVFETIGMISVFCARFTQTDDIVLTGALSTIPQAKPLFAKFSRIFGKNFIIPEYSRFGTVIGAALSLPKECS